MSNPTQELQWGSARPCADFQVYIDYDSTLFETRGRFAEDFRGEIVRAADVTLDELLEDEQHFTLDGTPRRYCFDEHMRSYGLEPEQVLRTVELLATDHDYLFPDSRAFFQGLYDDGFQPRILTFGERPFQTAKITPNLPRLTGDLDASVLDVIVVNYRKRKYIASQHPEGRGVLVDDVYGQDLPPGFTEITLDRSGDPSIIRRSEAGYIVANLLQARKVIYLLSKGYPIR